jgi:D-alanyl-D-alanine carboxypeptidase (penicillin-binding protein 5/6)
VPDRKARVNLESYRIITKKTLRILTAAAVAAAVLISAFSGSAAAAGTVKNISGLDQNYTGSVTEGKYTTMWGVVYGGNFDTGENTKADLWSNTINTEEKADYLLGKVKIQGKSCIVLDANTGNVLYNKNMNKKIYPASCTKVLTAIVAIENSNLDDIITVKKDATELSYNSSNIALKPGEKISMEQALFALLLSSANDSAIAIAEHVGGSVDGFAEMMNEKAESIGCSDTHFTNANGLYDKDHYTTAHDLALIMQYASKNKIFERIDSSWRYTMKKTNKSDARDLWNTHYMVCTKYYYLDGIVGGKTGYIDESKFNLITHYQKNGQDLIIVDCTANSAGEYCRDTQKLIKAVSSQYTLTGVSSSDIDVGEVSVDTTTVEKDIEGRIASKMYLELPEGADISDVKYSFVSSRNVSSNISDGDVIGTEIAVYNGRTIGAAVVTAKNATMSSVVDIAVLAVIIIVALIMIAVLRSRRRRNRRRYRSRHVKTRRG